MSIDSALATPAKPLALSPLPAIVMIAHQGKSPARRGRVLQSDGGRPIDKARERR